MEDTSQLLISLGVLEAILIANSQVGMMITLNFTLSLCISLASQTR